MSACLGKGRLTRARSQQYEQHQSVLLNRDTKQAVADTRIQNSHGSPVGEALNTSPDSVPASLPMVFPSHNHGAASASCIAIPSACLAATISCLEVPRDSGGYMLLRRSSKLVAQDSFLALNPTISAESRERTSSFLTVWPPSGFVNHGSHLVYPELQSMFAGAHEGLVVCSQGRSRYRSLWGPTDWGFR